MRKNSYECSICNQKFGRKANAERHNELKHDDLATIIDTKLQSDTTVISQSKNPFNKNKFKQFQSHSIKKENNLSDELFSRYFQFKPDGDILKVMRIFSQLKQPFDDLERLIDENDEYLRADIISKILISCLNSHRPIKCMKDTVEMYRSIKCMNKIAYYFLKSKKFSSIEEAIFFLSNYVKNSDYFKRNIN